MTNSQVAGNAQRRLIPAQPYLARGPGDDQIIANSENPKAPKWALNEASSKAKRDKLDPINQKTVIDLRNNGKTPISSSAKEKRKASDVEDDSDDSDVTAVDGPFTPTTLAPICPRYDTELDM
ncbi:hypothetical protein C8J56DRAFT_1066969 [Mycena floridula]|nr:hypothetical protein C8J56DRAFT_1066969 [Mycena floridula]